MEDRTKLEGTTCRKCIYYAHFPNETAHLCFRKAPPPAVIDLQGVCQFFEAAPRRARREI